MGLFGRKKRTKKQKQFSDLSSVAMAESRYAVPHNDTEQADLTEDDSKIVETMPPAIGGKDSLSPTAETKNIELKPTSSTKAEPIDVDLSRSSGSRVSKTASKLSNRASSRGSKASLKNAPEAIATPDVSASLSVPSISESRDETVGMSNRKSSSSSRVMNKYYIPSSKSSHSAILEQEKSEDGVSEKKDADSSAVLINKTESDTSEQTGSSKKSKNTFMDMLLGKHEEKPKEVAVAVEPEKPVKKEEEVKEPIADREVNYDICPTLLYKFIEYKDWDEAMERCKVAPDEAKTWVFRYDDHDKDEIYYGESLTKTIRWKMLPIHVAIIFKAPLKVVNAILDANPACIRCADDRKMLPLHLCARNLTDPSLAKYLIEREPETLTYTDYKGRNPLKILTEYRDKIAEKKDEKSMLDVQQRNSIIELMRNKMDIVDAKSDNESIAESDEDEQENKALTTEEDQQVEASDSLLSKQSSVSDCGPSGVKKSAPDNLDTMNQSIPRKPSIKPSRTQSLKKSSTPKIERKPTSEDDTFVITPQEIIPQEERQRNYLKRDKKKTPREVDYDTTPTVLIKLIERKMWEQAITRCVENPEEASTWMSRLQEVNDKLEGKKEIRWKILPIHSAIVLHAPVEVIEALVNAYPQGLRKGDDRKMLPLHMAFRLGASPETTAVLVDAYPDAIKKKDSKGHTPLHILKAYRRKYQKERNRGSRSNTDMDKNRKHLIRFYLGSRRYGSDDDATLAPYDSGSDSDDDSEYSDDSAWDDDYDDDEEDYDRLFNRSMFTDFGRLTVEGITAVPEMLRDTLACRTRY